MKLCHHFDCTSMLCRSTYSTSYQRRTSAAGAHHIRYRLLCINKAVEIGNVRKIFQLNIDVRQNKY